MRRYRKLHMPALIAAASLVLPMTAYAQAADEAEKPAGEKADDGPRRGKRHGKRGAGFRRPIEGPGPMGDEDEMRPPFGGRRGGPGHGEGPPMHMLSDEELQEMYDFVKEHFPMWHQRIQRMGADDPKARRRIAARIGPRIMQLIEVYRRNPELGELMIQDHQLEEDVRKKVHAYRNASENDRKQIEQEIRSLMARHFDVRQKRRAIEITELEKRIAEQKRLLEERSANKESIIARELDRRLHPELEF